MARRDLVVVLPGVSELVLHLLLKPALAPAAKPRERRMAISGEIPMRPLSSIERVLRDTASLFAVSFTVSPRAVTRCSIAFVNSYCPLSVTVTP